MIDKVLRPISKGMAIVTVVGGTLMLTEEAVVADKRFPDGSGQAHASHQRSKLEFTTISVTTASSASYFLKIA